MSKNIVASAELSVERRSDKSTVRLDINEGDVEQKAFRCCPAGSADCGFAGIELGTTIENGKQGVEALCGNVGKCALESDRLQQGLDRLSSSAQPI